MTVGELKEKLQYYNDNAIVVLDSDCIHGTTINQDFSIQTNDGDYNSPVYIEFSLGNMVAPIKTYKQDFLGKFPNAEIEEFTEEPVACVNNIYGRNTVICNDKCRDCWNTFMDN